ncbi:MAG TPA: amino acid ABC transporter permease [Actinomycetota bacterium]|jgi:polar amino acid transport system permease protein|nr:amino acid ABC transporter permease [Actinomycetota bacterium]
MAIATSVDRSTAQPPDTRGPSTPFPTLILWLGLASLGLVLGGTLLIQFGRAIQGGVLTESCVNVGILPRIKGARGVCNILEALGSPAETALLIGGAAIGIVSVAAGWARFRSMDTKRKRQQAITGAVLGIQAVVLALVIQWFRSGRPDLFVKNFLNVDVLHGYASSFFLGIRNTLVLAFTGEIGGIAIGLILSLLALSERRAVRAPARTYINFFRGTPLIWQLATGYFLLLFGFRLHLSAFVVAMLVFALNTGAYAAEVFRAGIQSIERGQMEAARSLGMSYLQAMRYAIVPQAVRRVIPPLMNEFVILIKDTALVIVLGLVQSQYELFTWAKTGVSDTFNATFFTMAAIGYLAVTLPLIRLVNAVERRLRSGLVGIAGAGA